MSHTESPKSVDEKLSIVIEGLKETTNISDLCRNHGISQTTYYNWRDKFFEGGEGALAANGSAARSSPRGKQSIMLADSSLRLQIVK
jgi:transposase-like protein